MPSAFVVNTRSSRQGLKSFAAGNQPCAMLCSLPAFKPIKPPSAAKFTGLPSWPEASSESSSASLKPAALAAAPAETFDIARALRMMSPRWSSRFIEVEKTSRLPLSPSDGERVTEGPERGGFEQSPLDHRRAPRQAGAEDHDENQVAAVDSARMHGFIQRNGDRGGRRVAVFVEVHKHLFRLRAEPFAHRLDDAPVGLMGDDAFDLGDVNLTAAHDFLARTEHRLHGVLERFLAFHAQEMLLRLNRVARRRAPAAAAGHVKQLRLAAVRAHDGGEQAVRMGTVLQNRRARAVAKEHASVAVLPVHNGRKLLRADDQHGVVGARHDELLRDFEAVDKTGARR